MQSYAVGMININERATGIDSCFALAVAQLLNLKMVTTSIASVLL